MRPEVGQIQGFVQQQDGILGRGELQHHGGLRLSGGRRINAAAAGCVYLARAIPYSSAGMHVPRELTAIPALPYFVNRPVLFAVVGPTSLPPPPSHVVVWLSGEKDKRA